MIQNPCKYQIQVRGTVDENTFNTKSPLQVKVVQADSDTILFAVYADQSGLIGLIRHLHGQGYVILSVRRAEDESILSKENPTHDRNNL